MRANIRFNAKEHSASGVHTGMRVWLLALVLGVIGCGAEARDVGAPATLAPAQVIGVTQPLRLWAHSPELEAPARSAAARILAATGIPVEVNTPGTSSTATPLFWSEQHGRWIGICGPRQAWIGIDSGLQARPADLPIVVLHEVMHAIGATHLLDGVVGVMAPEVQGAGDGQLTVADLVSVCSAADCTAFAPEDQ